MVDPALSSAGHNSMLVDSGIDLAEILLSKALVRSYPICKSLLVLLGFASVCKPRTRAVDEVLQGPTRL